MKTSDFDYDLPDELIAQHPLPERTAARMMVVRRGTRSFEHRHVSDLPEFLDPGDLLVVNDTRVIPARISGRKTGTGGNVEVLLLEELEPGKWSAMCKASGKMRKGIRFELANGKMNATVLSTGPEGDIVLEVESERPVNEVLEEEGQPPLPPYIRRPGGPEPGDKQCYQTVYAKNPGAVAAPTAGMHFTKELMDQLAGRGVKRAEVTLHVGAGTFKPLRTEDVDAHRMDAERYAITDQAASLINATRREGGRIVAVGTTTVRTLESAALDHGSIRPCEGRTMLFVRPPFTFRMTDVLLTNFHLPRSTLLMLVSAFAGRDLVMKAYEEAVMERYRFYSYGDCMLIL